MRHDMTKVLTERPRCNALHDYGDFRAKRKYNGFDDLPSCEGMRRPYGYERKKFSDLIGPLHRYLRSCVGRRWDDVWSEVCGQPSNRTDDAHLRDHVRQNVEVDTFLLDGEIKVRSRWSGPSDPYGLYVDPRDGVLRETPEKRNFWRAERASLVFFDGFAYREEGGVLYPSKFGRDTGLYPRKIIGREKEAVKIGGVWYWVVFATKPPATVLPTGMVLDRKLIDLVTRREVREGRYRADKRQMSNRDLRLHGLVND